MIVHSDHISQAIEDGYDEAGSSRLVENMGVCRDCLRAIMDGQDKLTTDEKIAFGQGIMIGARACQIAIGERN